jgi:hypothetical protein
VIVPPDTIDGSIRVSTFNDVLGEGAVDGAFQVPPPDITCAGIETSRSVTLRLGRSLVARGVVSADDGFTACGADVPVAIQRRVGGGLKTVRTTTTISTGSYRKRSRTRPAGTGHGPEDRAEWVLPPSPLHMSYLTHSVQRLGSRSPREHDRLDGRSDPHPDRREHA